MGQSKGMDMKGEGPEDDEKAKIMARVLAVWKRAPELRLGQLLEAACMGSIFYRKDFRLVEDLEAWVTQHRPAVEDKLEP
jgi:hypothetical protein